MKYIVDSKEVSRDTFYFCKRAKEENKSFVLLNPTKGIESYINNHPEYDYYIRNNISAYYTKGEKLFKEWFDKSFGWSTSTIEDMKKRYSKSKFKDTMTFEEWCTKNGWEYKSETKYKGECHDIPTVEEFEEDGVKTKLFSVTVKNEDTVQAINKVKDEYSDCIEYVLRDIGYTEIIYRDYYKEIKEAECFNSELA